MIHWQWAYNDDDNKYDDDDNDDDGDAGHDEDNEMMIIMRMIRMIPSMIWYYNLLDSKNT